MNSRRHIVVAAGDRRLRERLVRLFQDAGHEVSDGAAGKSALESIGEPLPALVTVDFRLSDMWGYELCHRLRERFGESIPLVLLSPEDRNQPHDRVAALLIGADECFAKPFDDWEFLLHAERLMSRVTTSTDTDRGVDLTPRELEILRLLAQGLAPASVAKHLYISRRTVETHVQHILGKLGVHSRTEAVALAYRSGIVAPGEEWEAGGTPMSGPMAR